jgi:hypothetical protein
VSSSIWVNPNDFEGIELALSTVNAVDHLSLPFDAAARRLWGTPLVVSTAAAGTSYSVAAGAVGLNTDGRGAELTWSKTSNADDWSKNLIRARCEGRFATSVFAPLGVVVGRSNRVRTWSRGVRPATPVPPWGSSARRAGRGVRAPATRWAPITWSPTNSSGTAEHGDQQGPQARVDRPRGGS